MSTPSANTDLQLIEHVERVLELQRNVWEALLMAKAAPERYGATEIMSGLERASAEVELIKTALRPSGPDENLGRQVRQRFQRKYSWISHDLPASLDPVATVFERPSELVYSLLAYATTRPGMYQWAGLIFLITAWSSYRTTHLRKYISEEQQLTPSLLACAVVTIAFRLITVQLCISYVVYLAEEAFELAHISQWTSAFTSLRTAPASVLASANDGNKTALNTNVSEYYSSTMATMLAVFIGIWIGF